MAAITASTTLLLASVSVVAGIGRNPAPGARDRNAGQTASHLVVSEVQTGGASAADEFVEIYNPTDAALSLAGIELIYVSASGSTITRRAAWNEGVVPAYSHLLVANEAGIYATIGDVRYAGGASSTGGSVALRRTGEGTAIDAVGWGTASNAWTEGLAADAPPAGDSIERLPGGEHGSGLDSDNNAVDFVVRADPDPQNSGSAPVGPPTAGPSGTPAGTPGATSDAATPTATGATPSISPKATSSAVPTTAPSSKPTSSIAASATPAPAAIPISVARAAPAGSRVTINGVALTSSSFTEGGGYIADDTAGIAVLVSGGSFERGERVQVTGVVANRYHQWTLRATASDLSRLGVGEDPGAEPVATGQVGEEYEARLVLVSGTVVGSPTELSAGLAYEVDDGSGPVRVLVLSGTGIDSSSWRSGTELEIRGVVGQRDSTGSGASGYRVQPRGADDVLAVRQPPAGTTPTPSAPQATPSAAPDDTPDLVTIARAREQSSGTRTRVRGVVTAGTGRLVDERSAVIQDATGGLLLRLGDDAPSLERGSFVEVTGERATKAGMSTLRVEHVALVGEQAEPAAQRMTTAAAGEDAEAELVVARGVVSSAVRESSTGSVSFDLDDGSGPVRVFAFGTVELQAASVERGSWIEVRGVLGQETSGDRPEAGYRIWPREPNDLRLVAPATGPADATSGGGDTGAAGGRSGGADGDAETGRTEEQSLADVVDAAGSPGRARATLVVGEWPEIGLAAVVWDGERAAGIAETGDAAERVREAVELPPAVVQLRGAAREAALGPLNGTVIELDGAADLEVVAGTPVPPVSDLPGEGEVVWGRVVGVLRAEDGALALEADGRRVAVDYACRAPLPDVESFLRDEAAFVADGLLGMSPEGADAEAGGAAASGAATIVVPCGALRPAPVLAAGAPDLAQPTDTTPRLAPSAASGTVPTTVLLAGGLASAALLAITAALAWRWGTIGRLVSAYRSAMTGSDDGPGTSAGG